MLTLAQEIAHTHPAPTLSPGMILASILAGLGFFFVGIKLLRDNLRQVTGPRFRKTLQRVADNPVRSALWGILTGFVTQSGRVTALLMSSLIATGTMTVRQALPLIVWSNVGCSLIVITALVPVNLLVLMVIGLGGICFAYEYPKHSKHLYSSLFGLALFMYGLGQIKLTSEELVKLPAMHKTIAFLHHFEAGGFILGLALTLIAQSHMGIILLVIALASAETISLHELTLIIYGAHLGSSLVTYIFSISSFQGSARQTLMGQVLYNIVGVSIFLPLYILERLTDIPLALWLARQVGDSVPLQAGLITLLFNVVTSAVLMVVYPAYLSLVQKLYPAHIHEELSKPKFISDAYLDQPQAAIDLAQKELLRLIKRLPVFLDTLREAPQRQNHDESHDNLADYHQSFTQVAARLAEYTASLLSSQVSSQDAQALMSLRARTAILTTIEEDLHSLALQLQSLPPSSPLSLLRHTLVEGLDTVLLTLAEAAQTSDIEEVKMLAAMTADKGPLIKNLRDNLLASESRLSPADRILMLDAGNLFERITWSTSRLATLMNTL